MLQTSILPFSPVCKRQDFLNWLVPVENENLKLVFPNYKKHKRKTCKTEDSNLLPPTSTHPPIGTPVPISQVTTQFPFPPRSHFPLTHSTSPHPDIISHCKCPVKCYETTSKNLGSNFRLFEQTYATSVVYGCLSNPKWLPRAYEENQIWSFIETIFFSFHHILVKKCLSPSLHDLFIQILWSIPP